MALGAGTAEGWDTDGRFVYRCPNGHGEVRNHPAWVWWCPLCGAKILGPQVQD
jgi:hypothetical protein